MFLTYLLLAGLFSASIIAIAFTVSYFMTLSDMKRAIRNHDTNGATKATVEEVVGSALSTAKTVKVGLFKGSERVGDVTIECTNGTSVTKYDTVYDI
jgi:hypothetical protein